VAIISLSSIQYLFFIFVFALFHYFIPFCASKWLLLAACIYFYMSWTPTALPVLLTVTLISYLGGLILERLKMHGKQSRPALAAFIIFSISPLLVCKYTSFFVDCLQHVFHLFGQHVTLSSPSFLLPMGISFFSLQAVSYLVDVEKNKFAAEHNFLNYFLFMSFFPSVTSGPICRAPDLLPQFRQKQKVSYRMVKHACLRILWGFFLKLVIADRIAPWVTFIYSNTHKYAGLPMWSAVLLYGFEIYMDFAGYTHIALGSAELFGFHLPENFNLPYLSRSIREFWRRWHISFSTWLRDYIYIPLGGNRCSKARKYFNVMMTFVVSGFWHGAGLNFIVWGTLHGIYQIIGGLLAPAREKLTNRLHIQQQSKLRTLLSTLFIFCLVDFTWIFFRCHSMRNALSVINALMHNGTASFLQLVSEQFSNGLPGFWLVIGCIALVMILECLQLHFGRLYPKWLHWNGLLQWACIFLLLIFVAICGVYGPNYSAQSFIYAKF
jgi:D-alanyl-lipoteichoic acid acyltransferase DltB (MBOAT superfamily)